MRINGFRTIWGPNLFHYKPVIVMTLSLEEEADKWSDDYASLYEKLTAWLPGLKTHVCSRGYEGGFLERLAEGTKLGHVVEHVALELSELAGVPVNFGKTVQKKRGRDDVYLVVVRFKSEHGMRALLRLAVEMVDAAAKNRDFLFEAAIAEAKNLVARTAIGPSGRAIVEAAEKRGIPWRRLNDFSLVQLGYGKHRRIIQAALTCRTSAVAMEIVSDKALTKKILADAFIPVPFGVVVENEEEALEALRRIGGPAAVKPEIGNHGNGVSLGVETEEDLRAAFALARKHDRQVIVEEMFQGRDYRALVVNGKLVAASERAPACVTGDGVHAVRELVALANQAPDRGDGHDRPLTRIEIDDAVEVLLGKIGMTLDSVPGAGEVVRLRANANISSGGTARDVTDEVHPEVAGMCEQAARLVGLDICGVDLVLPGVDQPLFRQERTGQRVGPFGGVIELNAGPGLRMHVHPSEGRPRDAGGAIVDMLYPPGTSARIPIIAITGTNGKTTVARLAAYILSSSGLIVGQTSTDGVQIAGRYVAKGDMTGPQSARTVLADPAIDAAVLEIARGGIVRAGLGYDWSDVGVVTNIQLDHIGQDDIESIDDLIHIKSLVAERVKEGGVLVLNADDENSAGLADLDRVKRISRRIAYVSTQPNNPVVTGHIADGGTAFRVSQGVIVETQDGQDFSIAPVSALPMAFGGRADFQVSNALCAAAACRALGVSRETIAGALASFQNEAHNPGRTNLYQIGDGMLLVDYGHNPKAFEEISRLRPTFAGKRFIGIIAAPGDRADDIIRECGRVAAEGFDEIIIREDEDTRGRPVGETARLLCEGVRSVFPHKPCDIVLDEREALRRAVQEARRGGAAVFFLDKKDMVDEILFESGAQPLRHDAPGRLEGD